jgi:hypothetical protein
VAIFGIDPGVSTQTYPGEIRWWKIDLNPDRIKPRDFHQRSPHGHKLANLEKFIDNCAIYRRNREAVAYLILQECNLGRGIFQIGLGGML